MTKIIVTLAILTCGIAKAADPSTDQGQSTCAFPKADRVFLSCDKTTEQVAAEIKVLQMEVARLETTENALTADDQAWLESVKFELTIRQTESAANAYRGHAQSDSTIKNRRCILIDKNGLPSPR